MKIALLSAALLAALACTADARDQIRIVGSSTVYPFVTKVAEEFGKKTRFKTPVIESTGTGGGFKLFCAGVGPGHPDVSNASRAIKASEVETCRRNGVAEVAEVKIGYDGIVLANAKRARRYDLTLKEIFAALAKQVPNAQGELVKNPHETWKDVDPRLPDVRIEVLGPPPTSGTRDAFVELAMEGGCKEYPSIAKLEKADEAAFKSACHTVREDGRYVEAGENDNLIVQKLGKSSEALGIFGYSFLDQNRDVIQGSRIAGVAPTFENIASGEYAISRPLYVYVKKAHAGAIPGLGALVKELTSPSAMGEEGYLSELGLVPLSGEELARVRATAAGLAGDGAAR